MTRFITICIGAMLIGLIATGQGYAEIDPDSVLGAWFLDEGSGDLAKDASGNGFDGTLVNSPTWVAGAFGGALEFDGASTYVDCGNDPAFNVGVFSVSFWCYVPATQAWNHMISRGQHLASGTPGSVNWGVMMYSAQETILFECFNDTGWSGINTPTSTGEWHHVVATYDGSAMQLYHDGELGASNSGAGLLLDESRSFVIGSRSDAGGPTGGYFSGSLDDVGYFNVVLAEEDIQKIMDKGLSKIVGHSVIATNPQPTIGQTDVPCDVVLDWTPGDLAATHNVYFSSRFDDVSNAAADALIADGVAEVGVAPGTLDFETTYYWRVDEVNAAPDYDVFEGLVWNFTTEPFAYPIQGILATSNAIYQASAGPENTVNGSGLDEADLHGTESADMFIADPGDDPVYLQYEFDQIYKLHEMQVWNYNGTFESVLGFGCREVTVEYSLDGQIWTTLADVELAQGISQAGYAANTTVAFGGVAAQYVKITVHSNWGGGANPKYGLSEVRFLYIPAHAREPEPADGAVNVDVTSVLAWRSGRDAETHEVYLGTDAEALPLTATPETASYDPGGLNLDTTYYWKVDETSSDDGLLWPSDVWSFATQEYLVVDDFESYDNDENLIYMTWEDGWVNGTGSVVGYFETPFAETTIVHSGRQSMPLFYDNDGFSTSEADLHLDQNWAANGIQSLCLYFYGAADNTGGQLYVKINGNKVPYDGPAGNITRTTWQLWSVDLSEAGNVSNVNTLTIGIEGNGASGVLYVDDIRLYPEVFAYTASDVTATGDVVQGVPNEGVTTDSANNGWPAAETPDLAIDDDVNTKYLHFKGEIEPTGLQITPSVGATIVTGLALTTANDAIERDPVTFELYGSNTSIDGPYTLIASGDLVDFAQETAWPRFTRTETPISFENDVAYVHYQILFPAVRDPGSANSMQIAEVELLGDTAP